MTLFFIIVLIYDLCDKILLPGFSYSNVYLCKSSKIKQENVVFLYHIWWNAMHSWSYGIQISSSTSVNSANNIWITLRDGERNPDTIELHMEFYMSHFIQMRRVWKIALSYKSQQFVSFFCANIVLKFQEQMWGNDECKPRWSFS